MEVRLRLKSQQGWSNWHLATVEIHYHPLPHCARGNSCQNPMRTGPWKKGLSNRSCSHSWTNAVKTGKGRGKQTPWLLSPPILTPPNNVSHCKLEPSCSSPQLSASRVKAPAREGRHWNLLGANRKQPYQETAVSLFSWGVQ